MLISKFLSNTFATVGMVSAPVVGVGFLYKSYPNALSTNANRKKSSNTPEEIEEELKKAAIVASASNSAPVQVAAPAADVNPPISVPPPPPSPPVVDDTQNIDEINKALEEILKKKITEKKGSGSSTDDSDKSVTLSQEEWKTIIEEIITEWEKKVKDVKNETEKGKWNKAIDAVKKIKTSLSENTTQKD